MNSIEKQLKALRDERAAGNPDARWLASAKETLLMQIGNTVGSERRVAPSALLKGLRLFLPENLMRTMMMPVLVLALVVGAGASSLAAVAAARDTLPGDALYGVKLAAERVKLRFTPQAERAERRIELAGLRLDEITRLSSRTGSDKERKITEVAGRFSEEMADIRKDLIDLQKQEDVEAAARIAAHIDAEADRYQTFFKSGLLVGRPALRMALLNLDQVSVKALEILVEKQSLAANVLPEAELTSSVGKRIESFAAHVAVTKDDLKVQAAAAAPQSLLLAAKAEKAVEEAQQLFLTGDFQAAVRKVSESADLVSEAQASKDEPSKAVTVSSTETPEVDSATSVP